MNTKLLKQKILDLAIRGKLTQQLKSDGTAADLLKEIADAKSALSQPKGKKSQNLGQIIPLEKSEAPFEIPANWEWVRLGDVASDFQYGSAEKSQPEGKIAVLRMGNINRQGQVDYSDLVYTSNDAEIAKYLLNKNDVLFNRTNSPEWVGKTAIYKGEIPAIYAGYIIRIKPHFNSDHPNYLMCSDYERNWSKEVKTDGVHQSNINAQKLMAFAVPLPPLAEQQRIVEKIQEAFAEIDSIENNKELLKKHIKQARQKILDLAIHGKLVPQNKADEPASVLLERITRDNPHYEKLTDVPFEIPDSWEWVKLGYLGNTNIGLTYHPNEIVDNGIPVLRSNNIVAGKLDLSNLVCVNSKILDNQFLNTGDILICARNGSQSLVGKCAIVDNSAKHFSFGAFMAVFRSEYNPFIYHYLNSEYFRDYMFEANSTQICQLTQNMLKNALIPLPPLAEQKRIVARIEEIFASLDEISLHLV